MAADAIIGLPETRVGLIPDVGGSSRLPSVVGLGRAKEMIMASKLIDGTEAERIGLVNRVVGGRGARGDDRRAGRRAARRARRSRSATPSASSTPSAKPALAATLEQEVTSQEMCAHTEDFAEATRAFAEKRQPEFTAVAGRCTRRRRTSPRSRRSSTAATPRPARTCCASTAPSTG